MVDRTFRAAGAVRALRLFAVLALLFTGWLGAVAPVAAQSSSVDVAIFTHENGQPAYDACYILVGFSDVGCDENADGRVMFADVPYGTYTVHQTADLGPGRYVADFTIDVTGYRNSAGFESHSADIIHTSGSSSGSGSSAQTSNVAIWTKENGDNAYDACYVLVDFSDVGCDENGDGKVTFMDVPAGTYTVHQTADLGPNRSVPDFTIQVTGQTADMSTDGWEPFTATIVTTGSDASGPEIRGAGAPPAPDSIDISLITRDPDDGHLLTGACYVLVGYSNEGCDEDGDGQVTFDDVPSGTYTVRQTQTPSGYPTINDYDISVEPRFQDVPVGFIVKQAPKQNAPSTRNVSVLLVDSRTFIKVVSPMCLQIGNVSDVGCDEDLVDGQIDFLDVQSGTHDMKFSNLPSGWEILGEGQSGHSVTIESGTGPQIIYIAVYVPDGANTSSGSGNAVTGSSGTLSSAQGNAEMRDMKISARTCTDPAALQPGSKADDACFWEIGATFTVTTEDGNYIGSCTLEGDRNALVLIAGYVNCTVPVPVGVRVIITEDVNTITPGTTPRENPLDYTWPTNPQSVASYMGVAFFNVPTETVSTSGPSGSNGSEASTQETWSAPVVVWICEDSAASVLDCRGEAGIKVDISLASGELAGSCTTSDPTATPWGKASYCVVNDLPFNRDFVARQDPSTIPAGYVPAQESIELHVGSVNPVGFEDVAFAFRNNRDTARSTGSSGTSVSNSSSQATLLMTFRGCHEEFDPNTDDFFANCTIPLDAPDASIIVWGGDGQGGMSITALDRQENGAYVHTAGPNTMHLQLMKMAPVVRDGYQVIGADEANGDTYTVNLVDGETREVFVFYYFE